MKNDGFDLGVNKSGKFWWQSTIEVVVPNIESEERDETTTGFGGSKFARSELGYC